MILPILVGLVAFLAGCKREPTVVSAHPRRIVSVTITGDVLLQALVDSSRVLAVSSLADDSGIHEAAGLFPGKMRIGPELEKIVALQPDLILLGSFHDPSFLHAMDRAGLPVHLLHSPRTIEEVRGELRGAARRLGEQNRGDSLVNWMDSVLQAIHRRGEACIRHPRVLYWSEGYTAGDSSTVGEMLALVGARNAAAELRIHGSKPISVEDVLALSPDWILRSGWEAGGAMKGLPEALDALPAVKAGKVVVVPGKWLLSTSHRLALGADSLQKGLSTACQAEVGGVLPPKHGI